MTIIKNQTYLNKYKNLNEKVVSNANIPNGIKKIFRFLSLPVNQFFYIYLILNFSLKKNSENKYSENFKKPNLGCTLKENYISPGGMKIISIKSESLAEVADLRSK